MILDRTLAIIGVIATFIGAAVTWYSLKNDPSTALLAASGWVAAVLIGAALSCVAIKISNLLEKTQIQVVELVNNVQIEKARADKHENLSNALATMISDPPTPNRPARKRMPRSGENDAE